MSADPDVMLAGVSAPLVPDLVLSAQVVGCDGVPHATLSRDGKTWSVLRAVA